MSDPWKDPKIVYSSNSRATSTASTVRAEALVRVALGALRSTLGSAHPDTLVLVAGLGELLLDRGDLDGAEPLFREALAVSSRTLGDDHATTRASAEGLSCVMAALAAGGGGAAAAAADGATAAAAAAAPTPASVAAFAPPFRAAADPRARFFFAPMSM